MATMEAASGIPNHPNAHWVRADDPVYASTLSPDSMWLASSLVAKVRVLRSVGRIVHDPIATVYETARVEDIFKNANGPDSLVKVNDTTLIADNRMKEGDEFLDDQTLGPQDGSALVFLVSVGGHYLVNGISMPIHGFTAPSISKYALRADSSLVPLSVRNTVVYQRYNGQTLPSVLQQTATGTTTATKLRTTSPGAITAHDLTMKLLARNGIATPQQIATYRHALSNPYRYYSERAQIDLVRNRTRIPVTQPYTSW